MPHAAHAGASSRQLSARFSRQIAGALAGGLVLMAATVFATWWMAAQQDAAARGASARMVAGGVQAFEERTGKVVLDYAVWTDAYGAARAGDVAWMDANIGASTETDTFDMALVVPAGGGAGVGWPAGVGDSAFGGDVARTAQRLLAPVPVTEAAAASAYMWAGETLWFLAAARMVPQAGLPAGAGDADLPRLVIGYRVNAAGFDGVGSRFMIDDFGVARTPQPGRESLALPGADGAPAAYVTWRAPTPGRAVLQAALAPLFALMLVAGVAAFLVGREMVRSARRLEGALARASSADRLKTEFLGNVSHELRTPIGGVIGIAQLLRMRALDPESHEMLGLLLASAQSQLDLVNRLLDITRIETGAMDLDRTPFDPAATLEETVHLIAPQIARKGLALRLDIDPGARREVVGDPLAFRQIATNLVGNALKFTDRGEIAVELAADAGRGLQLVVADTGAGIDPALHQQIFERFFQVDGSASRRAGGAGLGLPISRALAELMGGSLSVESALGRGTTFTASLPLPAASGPHPVRDSARNAA